MRRVSTLLLAGLIHATASAQPSQWALEKSELTYRVSHLMHKVEGTSRSARGKGVCDEGGCRFLIAAPVNSFGTGDANRDLHMLETTRGARFPMVTVAAVLPDIPAGDSFAADITVEFAGGKTVYARVPFQVTERGPDVLRVRGRVPLNIQDFKIVPPSLLGIAIKDEAPVDVDLVWKRR